MKKDKVPQPRPGAGSVCASFHHQPSEPNQGLLQAGTGSLSTLSLRDESTQRTIAARKHSNINS